MYNMSYILYMSSSIIGEFIIMRGLEISSGRATVFNSTQFGLTHFPFMKLVHPVIHVYIVEITYFLFAKA